MSAPVALISSERCALRRWWVNRKISQLCCRWRRRRNASATGLNPHPSHQIRAALSNGCSSTNWAPSPTAQRRAARQAACPPPLRWMAPRPEMDTPAGLPLNNVLPTRLVFQYWPFNRLTAWPTCKIDSWTALPWRPLPWHSLDIIRPPMILTAATITSSGSKSDSASHSSRASPCSPLFLSRRDTLPPSECNVQMFCFARFCGRFVTERVMNARYFKK